MKIPLSLILFVFAFSGVSHAQFGPPPTFGAQKVAVDLDPLFKPPQAFKKTSKDLPLLFEKGQFKKPVQYQWLAEDKSRAIFKQRPAVNVVLELSILDGEVPVNEAIVDFYKGHFAGITISVFNTGDGGSITQKEFERRRQLIGKYISQILKARPRERKGNVRKGVMTSGYTWSSSLGKASLEYNVEAPTGDVDFVRLRVSRAQVGGMYAAAMRDRSVAQIRKSALAKNVRREGADVFIDNVPMVDQGAKGYCVVASVQRLFEYYGISCDMHQLGAIAGTTATGGTDTIEANRQLGKIDYLFKTHLKCVCISSNGRLHELKDDRFVGKPVADSKFFKSIYDHIDDGIPLLWALQVGRFPENPPLKNQTSGGHMRMIIGYNKQKNLLYFSDSWGAGHEKKSMNAQHARQATKSLFVMKPTIN